MTVTVKGFQGTVSDADMATHLPTVPGVVYTAADLAVTAVASARQVSVAAGSAWAHFVKYVSDAAQTLALAPPASGGKWYVIALNRQWSPTNTCVLEAVDVGIATDGTVPTAAPSPATLPTGLRNNPGTAGSTSAFGHHQPLTWVHVRAADTTLTLFDTRHVPSVGGVVQAMTLAALQLSGLYRTPLRGTLLTCADKITYRWNGAKWCPWDSPWIQWASTLNGVTLSGGGGTYSKYRWEAGYVHFQQYAIIGGGGGSGQLTIPVPEPVAYAYNDPQSSSLEGQVTLHDQTSGTNYHGIVQTIGLGLSAIGLAIEQVNQAFPFLVPITNGQPVTWVQSTQIWTDVKYQSSNYPFDV